MEMLNRVLGRIRPRDAGLIETVDAFVSQLNSIMFSMHMKAKAVTGGSIAKGTYLEGDYDVDIFVAFDRDYYRDDNLSAELSRALKSFDGVEKVHGSRNYFHLIHKGITFEIVPVLDVSEPSQAKNVTDMSPLHVAWFSRRASVQTSDEVRLAKQFCKSARVYGAESHINGFSGHVLDILVIHYGSFLKLVEAASDWEKPVVIDVENHLANPLEELNAAKVKSPLILVDPVQPDRNAAAALSEEKFNRFIERCREFLAKPSERFFTVKTYSESQLKDRFTGQRLVLLEVSPADGKKDVVGAKLLKVFEHILTHVKLNDFNVREADWQWDGSALMWFVFGTEDLPRVKKHMGPPEKKTSDAKAFREAHVRDEVCGEFGRLYAIVEREFTKPEAFIEHLIKDEFVTSRVRNIRLIAKT